MSREMSSPPATAKKPRPRKHRESFGTLGGPRKDNGRYYPNYPGPDGKRYRSPISFSTATDARAWLSGQKAAIEENRWTPSTVKSVRGKAVASDRGRVTFGEYATRYIEKKLTPRGEPRAENTRLSYVRSLGMARELSDMALAWISRDAINDWYRALVELPTKTTVARAYEFVSAVFREAVREGLIDQSPVNIRGAASRRTGKTVRVPNRADVDAVLEAMEERYRALVVVEGWGAIRMGEMRGLRRRDVKITADEYSDDGSLNVQLKIQEQVVYSKATSYQRTGPKSLAGDRTVWISSYFAHYLIEHLDKWVPDDPDALLFPAKKDAAKPLPYSTYHLMWTRAVAKAGAEYFNPHALRHFAGTEMAVAGATQRELMRILGHASGSAALNYQHAADERQVEVAELLAQRAREQDEKLRARQEREAQRRAAEAELAAAQARLAVLSADDDDETEGGEDNVVRVHFGR